jgi:hypothetical protein
MKVSLSIPTGENNSTQAQALFHPQREAATMHTPTDTLLARALKSLALRGYGWKRRKQRDNLSYRIEWQDPATGQWHGEKTALRLLKMTLMAEYDKPGQNNSRGDFRVYF